MSPFLKLNPSLVEVQLADHISSNSSNSNYIGTLAELPHLKLLILENVSIHEDNLDDCYRLFEKLETFRTASFDIAKHIAFDNIKFQRMRHLHLSPLLRYNEAGLLELMKAFPRIEHLHVTAPPRGIVCLFQNKTWSNLRGITLKMRLKDSDLEHVLRGIDRGTDLTFGLMNFGPLAFQALSLHFPTLTKLVIATCNDVTSIMVRDILCSCPCLEHFQAKTVKAKDIVEGGDWACNSLRVLFVHIEFSESEQSLQPKIFQRLSSLVLLCSLSIGLDNYRSGETLSYGLDIRLSKGLQLLSTLKQLRYLNVKGTIQSVGENDAKWISENLKSLKQFYGWRNNTHRDLNNSIQKMFDQCGINKFMR
ncbi:hypothetical protein BGZ46_009715 [Entomortierella lignicola]|nr:hypothetical protein BGZ46_009715 [Entomortierella lignicola]